MRLSDQDVNDALPPVICLTASQDVSRRHLKAPVYLVFRGFFVSERLTAVLARVASHIPQHQSKRRVSDAASEAVCTAAPAARKPLSQGLPTGQVSRKG